MANRPYDQRPDSRDPRGRVEGRDEPYRGQGRGRDEERSERGFFERASDEVASAERRRHMDDRGEQREGARYQPSGHDRPPRYRDDAYRQPHSGRPASRREAETDYRPMAGDYGRGSGPRQWDDERPRGERMAPTAMPAHDRHYGEWRQRQIEALDRDYDEYRREHQSKFENDFSNWRQTREGKRQMLGQVREHMPVVGSDEEPVGTVDKVIGDRIVLTRADSSDGKHHAFGCTMIDRVDGDRVILSSKAEEAKAQLIDQTRDRALFEREGQGSEGPHILDRSFSGTY